jgi:CxxC-x17-CxxC domain-containing protein
MRTFNKSNKFSKRDSGSSRKSGERRFERDSRDDDRSSGERRFERRESGRRESSFELHHATCDKCGRECDVPFKPTGGKPIYCRSCFRQNSESPDRGSFDNRSRDRFETRVPERSAPNPHQSTELDKINKKLDKIMKALKIE